MIQTKARSLVDVFNAHFEIVPVNTEPLLKIAHHIRYQVFSEELAYFDKRRFSDGFEHDMHDTVSIQSLIRLKSNGEYIGVVRLVAAIKDGKRTMIPLEGYYTATHSNSMVDLAAYDPKKYGEISRAAILPAYRHYKTEPYFITHEDAHQGTRMIRCRHPLVGLGLYLAAAAMGLYRDYEHIFAMMEPGLARRMHLFGIMMKQISPVVTDDRIPAAYQRAAFEISRQRLFAHAIPEIKTLLHQIESHFRSQHETTL